MPAFRLFSLLFAQHLLNRQRGKRTLWPKSQRRHTLPDTGHELHYQSIIQHVLKGVFQFLHMCKCTLQERLSFPKGWTTLWLLWHYDFVNWLWWCFFFGWCNRICWPNVDWQEAMSCLVENCCKIRFGLETMLKSCTADTRHAEQHLYWDLHPAIYVHCCHENSIQSTTLLLATCACLINANWVSYS